MFRLIPVTALAAILALPIGLPASEAHAQAASYCNGRLTATSFYFRQNSTGQRTDRTYYMRLQNTTNQPVSYTVTFYHMTVRSLQPGGIVATLPAYQSVEIGLAQQSVNNSSGNGLISPTDPNEGVPHFTSVACPPPRPVH